MTRPKCPKTRSISKERFRPSKAKIIKTTLTANSKLKWKTALETKRSRRKTQNHLFSLTLKNKPHKAQIRWGPILSQSNQAFRVKAERKSLHLAVFLRINKRRRHSTDTRTDIPNCTARITSVHRKLHKRRKVRSQKWAVRLKRLQNSCKRIHHCQELQISRFRISQSHSLSSQHMSLGLRSQLTLKRVKSLIER